MPSHEAGPAGGGVILRYNMTRWTTGFSKDATPSGDFAFEDRLDAAAQARVRRAVKSGAKVGDPDEAAVAVGLARREQRTVLRLGLILLPLQIAIAAVWVLLFVVGRQPAVFGWFWVAVLLVLMGVVPFALRRRQHVARRAAEANERVVRRLP